MTEKMMFLPIKDPVSKGVRHGCIMSPQLSNVYTESIMREREVEEEQNNIEYDELSVGGTKITELRNADDTSLLSTPPEGLNNLVQAVNKHSSAYKRSNKDHGTRQMARKYEHCYRQHKR